MEHPRPAPEDAIKFDRREVQQLMRSIQQDMLALQTLLTTRVTRFNASYGSGIHEGHSSSSSTANGMSKIDKRNEGMSTDVLEVIHGGQMDSLQDCRDMMDTVLQRMHWQTGKGNSTSSSSST